VSTNLYGYTTVGLARLDSLLAKPDGVAGSDSIGAPPSDKYSCTACRCGRLRRRRHSRPRCGRSAQRAASRPALPPRLLGEGEGVFSPPSDYRCHAVYRPYSGVVVDLNGTGVTTSLRRSAYAFGNPMATRLPHDSYSYGHGRKGFHVVASTCTRIIAPMVLGGDIRSRRVSGSHLMTTGATGLERHPWTRREGHRGRDTHHATHP